MKRNELKNKIKTGLKMTPDSWGESCLMIDEDLACVVMVNMFGEGTPQDYMDQIEGIETKIEYSIFELDGEFYAVEEPYYRNVGYGRMRMVPEDELMYAMCENTTEASGGMVGILGRWQQFDDE